MSRRPELIDVLLALPLFDNPFLSMQARNVALVDAHLRVLERELVHEYIDRERTPIPEIMLVSALSQFWVFGLYELLRTWRQSVIELIDYGDELEKIRHRPDFDVKKRSLFSRKRPHSIPFKLSEDFVEAIYARPFGTVESQPGFAAELQTAKDSMQSVLHRIEALRISLAKHEVRGTRGVRAYAPGYARIDMASHSLCWMVESKDGFSDMISRQSLVDALLSLHIKPDKNEEP